MNWTNIIRKLICNLGLHDWEKWGVSFTYAERDGSDEYVKRYTSSFRYQERTCKRCGKVEKRAV